MLARELANGFGCTMALWFGNLPRELEEALRRVRRGLIGVALLSAMINVLAITGSIYMMLVYDRVLPSQRLPTLFSLFAITAVVYLFSGVFEALRAHLLSDIGSAVDAMISPRARQIEQALARRSANAASPIAYLDQVRTFLGGPGPAALIDLPWIAFFLFLLAMVQIWLGVATLVGALAIVAVTVTAERMVRRSLVTVEDVSRSRRLLLEAQRRHAEVIAVMGMEGRIAAKWRAVTLQFLAAQAALAERTANLAAVSKTVRVFLQSTVLTVGAILVINGKATASIIFASSLLSGRALAPVDQAIANWRGFVGARKAWGRLARVLADHPEPAAPAVELPLPHASLTVERLTLRMPGRDQPCVAGVSFAAKAGDAIGVIGSSGAGKSSLLRGIVGALAPAQGEVRLDGARLDQWCHDTLGRAIGYLSQSADLLGDSIAQIIARLEPDPASDAVIAAAKAAGIHDLILRLPQGYDTVLADNPGVLSAGQRQRLGLARALYGDPFLLILDEPNSNLDPDGEVALTTAILHARQRGAIVLVATHRMAVLQAVDLALVMQDGRLQTFGPRDEVLAPRPPQHFQPRTPAGIVGSYAIGQGR